MIDIEKLACSQCGGIEFTVKSGVTMRVGGMVVNLPNMKTYQCVACGYESLPKEEQQKVWQLAKVLDVEEKS